MKKLIPCILPLLCIALLTGSCKTQQKASDSSAVRVDYRTYETYAFARPVLYSSEDPVFSWSQFEKRVKRELNFILPSKGLDQTNTDPDLLVYYYALVNPDKKPAIVDYTIGWAAEPFVERGEQLSRYPNNTFVVDLVDAHTRQLVWRSSTILPFTSPEKLYEVLPERLRTLLEPYPNIPEGP